MAVPDLSRETKRSTIRGLVFEAHRLLYHSTLGLRVIKKNKVRGADSQRLKDFCIEGSYLRLANF